MQEEFLHFVWKARRFDQRTLTTTSGQPLRVLDPGQHNHHAGPDFLEARIELEGTIWVGQIEMHLRASDWLRHEHQKDRAYDNVILHVVLEADLPIRRADGRRIPCLEMRPYLSAALLGRYKKLQQQAGWIPCQPQWPNPDPLALIGWLDRLLVERLQARIRRLQKALDHNRGDWEETFYQQLARGFGARVNADPFEQVAQRLPLRLLRRHRNSLLQMEALLFGQAGLLHDQYTDAYPQRLYREYQHLRHKYGLTPMPGVVWKFMRMRPNNFPTLRLAQFAALHHQGHALFAKVLSARNREEVENMFEVRLANYWKDHVRFDRPSAKRPKRLGKQAVHLIAINTIAPILFLYGRQHGKPALEQRAVALLEQLPAESNRIIRQWEAQGVAIGSAAHSQAALHWKRQYCDRRKCLQCLVGQALLA